VTFTTLKNNHSKLNEGEEKITNRIIHGDAAGLEANVSCDNSLYTVVGGEGQI
jgi:hypothetical protein